MQFVYEENASLEVLEIKDENYNYLIKARRHNIDDLIYFRNLKDQNIYLYKLNFIDRKKAILNLLSFEEKIIENQKKLHLGWCVVDPKTIEKYICSLNEMGIERITFIYSEFSQKNFKINLEKLEKIVINSSSQCGRSSLMKLDLCKNIETFIKENEDIYFLDFSNKKLEENSSDIKTLVVGPEGGFSKKERELMNEDYIVGLNTNLILRSETAIIAASSKVVL